MHDGAVFAAFTAAGVVCVLFAAAFWFSADLKMKRRIRSYPLVPRIADVPEYKDIRVSGTLAYAEGLAPLSAPFCKRPCVAWQVVVEAGVGKNWQEVIRENKAVDFVLEDESGKAIVDGTSLTLVLKNEILGKSGIFLGTSPELVEFCARRNVETLGRALRMREGILALNEVVTVCGQGRFERDVNAQTDYRSQAQVLRIGPLANGELLAGDDPKLGR